MFNNLVALIMAVFTGVTPAVQTTPADPSIFAEVDRTEDGDFAVTLVYVNDDVYVFDIPQSDFNTRKADGEDLNIDTAVGEFSSNDFMMTSPDGVKEKFYQFKSYDNEVWWCLTEDDMGFIPETGKKYTLVFYQNETTQQTHECPPEYECDCYCYDDVFLGVYEL